MPDIPISAKAARLHDEALVWDMTVPWGNIGRPERKVEALGRYSRSGVDVVSLTVARDDEMMADAIRALATERAYVQGNPDRFVLVESVDHVLQAKAQNKLAVILHFQGTNPVQGNLQLVELFYKLGVRHMLMAYNRRNFVGDGCHEPSDGGLSRFGRALVLEMNRVGMLVDCSHTGYRTSMDVFETSQAPVIFSHANPSALYQHPRNIKDDQIKACAHSGGVMGVNGIGVFMGENDASTEQLFRQIDYCVELVGPEHVGIGLDFVYDKEIFLRNIQGLSIKYPTGFGYERLDMEIAEPEQLPELTELLVSHGYAESHIRAILGENWLNVARRVWK